MADAEIKGIMPVLQWMADSFTIDHVDGSIIWKNPPYNHPRLMGASAGSMRPGRNGKIYCAIKMNRRAFRRGRLLFLWKNGYWPTPCLDHEDGDSTNDAEHNIRQATVQQNAWNHKSHAKDGTLPMGVRLNTSSGKYSARIGLNGVLITIGTFETPELASTAYRAKRREFYGEFA